MGSSAVKDVLSPLYALLLPGRRGGTRHRPRHGPLWPAVQEVELPERGVRRRCRCPRHHFRGIEDGERDWRLWFHPRQGGRDAKVLCINRQRDILGQGHSERERRDLSSLNRRAEGWRVGGFIDTYGADWPTASSNSFV